MLVLFVSIHILVTFDTGNVTSLPTGKLYRLLRTLSCLNTERDLHMALLNNKKQQDQEIYILSDDKNQRLRQLSSYKCMLSTVNLIVFFILLALLFIWILLC